MTDALHAYLSYREPEAALTWMGRLGFETVARVDGSDGALQHAEVRIGDRGAPPIAVHGRALDSSADKALAEGVSAKMDTKYGWSDGLIVELCPV